LWIDQFAGKIGVADPQPFLTGGSNYAVAGAQTGTANVQDIGKQIATFSATHLTGASSTALYTIWGGANDLFDATSGTVATAGRTAADNLYQYILTLAGEGAKNFIWMNLPNLGDTPLGASLGATGVATLNGETAQFNAEFALDLSTLRSDGVNVIGVNINSLFNGIIADPSAYGLTNVTTPAQGTSANPNDYLFWDTEHPTTAADALIADAVYTDYLAATPEPMSAGLSILGLGAVLAACKLRRKSTPVC
jgi:phospholipase/lecithinase/hemolysin